MRLGGGRVRLSGGRMRLGGRRMRLSGGRIRFGGGRMRLAGILFGAGLIVTGLFAFRPAPGDEISAVVAQDVELGQAVYAVRCAICHGVDGDGNGPAATSLDPRPRDLRRGWYKIRTTSSGQLPTDADLVRVITLGMPGTTMPGWEDVLTDEEILSVVEYVKTFSRRFERESPEPISIAAGPGSSPEAIARGAQLFGGEQAECQKCHGEMGRGDGPSASDLTDDFGQPIVPADLTMPWLFRGGPSGDDVYMRIKTGLTGSPMPSYAAVLSDEQLWDIAYYVDSLASDAPEEQEAFLLAAQVDGALPTTGDDPTWAEAPENYFPLGGQVMRESRNFTPGVKGVWVTALHNGSELALRLRWHDLFQDSSDSFDVEIPAVLAENDERPYFVFGDSRKVVNLWHWDGAGDLLEQNANGVGTRATQSQQNLAGQAEFADGEYTLVMKRALITGDPEDLAIPTGEFIPIAFSAAEGRSEETADSGAIGSWQLLFLDQPTSATSYLWVPIAIAAVAGLEWLIVRRVRQSASK